MIAKHIMNDKVLVIAPNTPVVQAIQLMSEHHISGLPVVDQDWLLVGILTEGDLLRRTEINTAGTPPGWFTSFFRPGREAQKYVLSHGRRVDEVMSTSVIVVDANAPLSEVVGSMMRHRVKRLPVTHNGRLVGIVSRADVVRRVAEVLAREPESRSDGAIHRAVKQAIAHEKWSPGKMIGITVKDGVVQLDGCLSDFRERTALGVLAENMPGVKSLENRIVCLEPYTGMVTYDPAAEADAQKIGVLAPS